MVSHIQVKTLANETAYNVKYTNTRKDADIHNTYRHMNKFL